MDALRKEFEHEAIQPNPNSLKMYKEETAVRMILRCKELGYKVIGLESYRVKGLSTQPFIEHSIDYPFFKFGSKGIGCWDEAIEFIKSKRQYGFVFDVFYLIPDEPVHDPFPDIMPMSKDENETWIVYHFMSNVRFIPEYSDTIEAGKVISYQINYGFVGEKIKRNTPIEIIISRGKAPPS